MLNFILKWKKIIGIIFIIIFVLVLFLILHFISKNRFEQKEYTLSKRTNNYEYNISIIKTGNKIIDKEMKTYIKEKISSISKKTNYKININYEIKEYKNIFTYDFIDLEYEGNNKIVEEHKVFNVKDNIFIKLNDIFEEKTDYKKYIEDRIYYYVLHYSYQNNIQVDESKLHDYNDFYMDQDGIHFYIYLENQKLEKIFSYPELDKYLKEEFKTYIGVSFEKLRVNRDIEQFRDKQIIAFTFDDGPAENTTNRLLDELDKRGVKVTFFVVGNNALKYPDIIKRMYLEGHDIGIHTYSHPNLLRLTDEEVLYQKTSVVDIVNGITGYSPTMLRPPYGSIDDRVKGIYPMKNILWNVDSEDWKSKNVDMIFEEIMKSTDDGDIVLLHDLYETSVDGALRSIDELSKMGYEFVTVSELLQIKGDIKDTYYGF